MVAPMPHRHRYLQCYKPFGVAADNGVINHLMC